MKTMEHSAGKDNNDTDNYYQYEISIIRRLEYKVDLPYGRLFSQILLIKCVAFNHANRSICVMYLGNCKFAILVLSVVLTACGGGSSGDGDAGSSGGKRFIFTDAGGRA